MKLGVLFFRCVMILSRAQFSVKRHCKSEHLASCHIQLCLDMNLRLLKGTQETKLKEVTRQHVSGPLTYKENQTESPISAGPL